jgi:hypothetical protein
MQALSQTELQPHIDHNITFSNFSEEPIYHPRTLLSKASHSRSNRHCLLKIALNVKLLIMNKIIFIFTLLIVSVPSIGFSDDPQQVITLKDGSQIKGVLSGIENGVYTVKTPIIGDIHVAASDVSSITNGDAPVAVTAAPATAPAAGSLDQQIAASQQKILSNPQSMAILQQMAQNPQMMQALQDPALVQAVANHDYQAVQNNPAVQKIINDPQIRALIQKIAAQQKQ